MLIEISFKSVKWKLSEIYREFYKRFDKTHLDLSNDLKKLMGFSIYLQGYFPISSMPFDDEIHRDEDGILMFCKILRMNPDAYR